MLKAMLLAAALALAVSDAQAAALTACTAGSTTCSNDTVNDSLIVAAINDPVTQLRVWNIWNQQCDDIFSESASTTGHSYRVTFCLSVAAQKVPLALLVSEVMNSTTEPEVLAGTQPGPIAGGGQAAGNLVDADVVTAIGVALTVDAASAATTATAASGSETLTVASGTGIVIGASAYCAGCAAGTTVAAVSGTTVYLNQPVTAALSSTPIEFELFSGLPTRAWQ
jgi:hypothetical protein